MSLVRGRAGVEPHEIRRGISHGPDGHLYSVTSGLRYRDTESLGLLCLGRTDFPGPYPPGLRLRDCYVCDQKLVTSDLEIRSGEPSPRGSHPQSAGFLGGRGTETTARTLGTRGVLHCSCYRGDRGGPFHPLLAIGTSVCELDLDSVLDRQISQGYRERSRGATRVEPSTGDISGPRTSSPLLCDSHFPLHPNQGSREAPAAAVAPSQPRVSPPLWRSRLAL